MSVYRICPPSLPDSSLPQRFSSTPHGPRPVSTLSIDLATLTPAERRDLANALLRAARGAALEHNRILLLVEIDAAVLGGSA